MSLSVIRSCLIAATVTFTFAATSYGDEIVGTQDGEYVLGENGLWWLGTQAFTRESELVAETGNWYWDRWACCWKWRVATPSYYRYKYRLVLNRAAPDFWTQYAKYKYELESDRIKAIALGAFPSSASASASASVSTTSTATYASQIQALQYPSLALPNLNESLQILGQNAKAAIDSGSQATADYGAVLQDTVDRMAQLGDLQLRLEAMRTVQPQAFTRTTTTLQQSQAGAGPAPADSLDYVNMDDATFSARVLQPQCASCHSAGKPQANLFDIAYYASLKPDLKAKVFQRITSTDPKVRMPFGKPALPLSMQVAFFKH